MVFNKKAISPVVATALLLVVAVVAVVGFQTWFNTYQAGLSTKVEQQSNTGSVVTIERLENVSNIIKVYLKNSGTTDLTKVKVTAGGSTCENASTTLTLSTVTTVTLGGTCSIVPGTAYEVVAITDGGVYSGKVLAR